MAVKMKTYGATTGKQILATPDHYVAIAVKHDQATAEEQGLAVLENGRYIVKAGTIYPKNDATATGVILNDYDVTDGDANMAVVIHGFIQKSKLPVQPASTAISALPMIKFL